MPTLGIRTKKQLEKRGTDQAVSVDEAIDRIKAMAEIKGDRNYAGAKKRKGFDQTVELHVHLGIDPKHADQNLRGSVSLPKGIGKSKRVIAFCDGADAEAAAQAGAIEVGVDELIQKITGGWMDFDVAVAHPSVMGKVGKLGRILGPSGKMPTPKSGTVSQNVATTVKEFSAGKIEYRNDTGGNLHVVVGRASFPKEDLKENIEAFMKLVHRIKPAAAKGQYVKRVCLAGTMTPSVTLDLA